MTPEDRLAELLREEAAQVTPVGDGLARIQQRLTRRRRTRWLLLPGAAVATGAAAAAVVVLTGGGAGTTLTQDPTTQPPTTSSSPSTPPTASAAPTVVGGGLDHAFENPALWPFTSAQEIATWRTDHPYAEDKTAVVRHYLQDVLGITGATLTKPCESCDVVDIRVAGHQVGTAALERFRLDGAQVYTISTVGGTDLKVTSPTLGEAVSSPTTVTGRITGVDEHVSLALLSQSGTTVATGGAQAGSAVPWSTRLTWTDTGWTHGGLVAKTFSAKDGTLNRLTAVPVMRGTAATPSFAAVRGGRVELLDAASGRLVKHLTYPPEGTADVSADYSSGTLLWVRTASSGCSSSVNRLSGGTAATLEPAGRYRYRDARLSRDGRTWAYLRQACDGSRVELVVRGASSWQRALTSTEPHLWDVRDDGTALYDDGGTWYVGSAGPRTTLRPATGCRFQAGAFDERTAGVWEACTGDASLISFDSSGRRVSSGAPDFSLVTAMSRSATGLLVVASPRRGAQTGVYVLDAGGEWREVLKDPAVISASW